MRIFRPLVVRFWRIGHKKCVAVSRSLKDPKPSRKQHTKAAQYRHKTSCKIAERTGHVTLAQPSIISSADSDIVDNPPRNSTLRRSPVEPDDAATMQSSYIRSTSQRKRSIFETNVPTTKACRQPTAATYQSAAAKLRNKAADKHNQIHKSMPRVEPCLNIVGASGISAADSAPQSSDECRLRVTSRQVSRIRSSPH